MATHQIKIHPVHFARIVSGVVTFLVLTNDPEKCFQAGDKLVLKEWDGRPLNPTDDMPYGFTGSPDLEYKIGYVQNVGRDEVVVSLLSIHKKPETDKTKDQKSKRT